MSDKIKEIHKRHAFADENKSVIRPAGFSWTIPGWQAHDDRATLLAEVERLRDQIERLRVAATSAGAALAAAIELLERGREDAPSKRMFSQMLADYRVIVARTRKALEDNL